MKLVFVDQLNWIIQIVFSLCSGKYGVVALPSTSPELQRLLRVSSSGVELLYLYSYLLMQSFKLLKIVKQYLKLKEVFCFCFPFCYTHECKWQVYDPIMGLFTLVFLEQY